MKNFEKLLLTPKLIDHLGGTMWGGAGDFCDVSIPLDESQIRFQYLDEKDDINDGYAFPAQYQSACFYTDQGFVYFLHELFDYILEHHEESVKAFYDLCKDKNMGIYLDQYIKSKYFKIERVIPNPKN